MLHKHPELDAFSVVAAGHFNPAIFHPGWMEARGIISPAELELVKTEIVSPDVSSLIFRHDEADPGLSLHVDPERMTVQSNDVLQLHKALDLFKNLLNVLSHTPVGAIGIHRHQHYRVDTQDEWNNFGHLLAPKNGIWDEAMSQPGLRSLKIESPVPDLNATLIFTVEPSRRLRPGQGIFLSSNLTFVISDAPAEADYSTAQAAAEKLVVGWEYAQEVTPNFAEKFRTLIRQ